MNTRRKSTLFLAEQLIVIAVFALCAIACISIFTASYFMAIDSRDTENALLAAQNCAEAFKAAGGDAEAVADILNSRRNHLTYDDNGFTFSIYMDKEWNERAFTGENAEYTLTLSGSTVRYDDGTNLVSGEVTVGRADGKILVTFPVAVRG